MGHKVLNSFKLPFILALGACCLAAAVPASAQIYAWRDDNGHLVLSDRARGSTTPRAYSVPRTETVRATRFVPANRSALYDELIQEHAQLNHVRTDLVRAVVQVESGFNPYARSPKGALGLMQLMPSTIRRFGVSNAFNPVENVRAGVAYLRQLLDRYSNNEELALAAYNAGPDAVDRHGQAVPPYKETRDYVMRIHGMAGRSIQPRSSTIYKSTEVVDGQPVPLYSDRKPSDGAFRVVNR